MISTWAGLESPQKSACVDNESYIILTPAPINGAFPINAANVRAKKNGKSVSNDEELQCCKCWNRYSKWKNISKMPILN